MQNFDLVGSISSSRRASKRLMEQKRRNTSNCICPLQGASFWQRQINTAKSAVARGVKAAIVGPAKPSSSLPDVADLPNPNASKPNYLLYGGIGVVALAAFALLGGRPKAA